MTEQKTIEKSESKNGPSKPMFGPPKSVVREYFEQGVITIIMALFLMTFIAQAVAVPTGSMQNTINIGDHLFVNKFIFGGSTPIIGKLLPTREIRRGDIIVFKQPLEPKVNYVKRVIGLPGDTVQVKGTDVYINGKVIPEIKSTVDYSGNYSQKSNLPVIQTDPTPPGAFYHVYYSDREHSGESKYAVDTPYKIPEKNYFVMGDNRDNSFDSRGWGTVPRENIFARALYVHWSYNSENPDVEHSFNRIVDIIKNAQWKRIGTAVK